MSDRIRIKDHSSKAKIIFSGGQLSKWIKQIILFSNYKKLIYKENDKIFTLFWNKTDLYFVFCTCNKSIVCAT